jgi:hypothetical protein
MSIHPFTWFHPSRLGGEATQLLSRTVTLASVLADRIANEVDGEQPTEVVALSYRGVDYEIDLTQKAANGLDHVLAPYLAKARRVTAQRRNTERLAVASSVAQDPREVRAWAKTRGIVVADRGRVSADVMRQYREAHSG